MFDALAFPRPGARWSGAVVAASLSHVVFIVIAVGGPPRAPANVRAVHRDTIRLELVRVEPSAPAGSARSPIASDAVVPDPPSMVDIPVEVAKLPQLSFTDQRPRKPAAVSVPGVVHGRPTSPDSAGPVFGAFDVDELPELIEELLPTYPDGLRRAGVGGLVQVEYVVGTEGRIHPQSVRVLASTHPAFVVTTRKALRDARFTPGRRGGRPIPVLVRQAIRFQLR